MVDSPERIDRLVYVKDTEKSPVKTTLFYNGPVEFLVHIIARELGKITPFSKIFGDSISGYRRMDFSHRQLPAVRVYNNTYRKDFDSWFIEGDILVDIILPASLRRDDTQQVQDTLSGAIVQQFRSPAFFLSLSEMVPGLNELGKTVNVDKSLGFEWEDQEVPLTQISLNFRLDLRMWDEYLESTNRTKDSPFTEVLGSLDSIVGIIDGLKDDNATTEVSIGVNADLTD